MKIAVTGASGHVGANLCRELLRQGHQVKALVHHDTRALQGLQVEQVPGDLTESKSLHSLCKDTEVVFHLGALISVNGDKARLEKINVHGTENLINVILQSNVKRMIHFSSIHALDNFPLDEPMNESRPLVPNAAMMYEATKARADRMVLDRVNDGLDAVIINPTAIVGPYDFKPSLVGQVLIRLYKGTLPALVPGGYDWVDVRDIVQAVIRAMTDGRKGERYILSGNWVSVRDLARMLEGVTGRKMVRLTVPTSLARLGVPFIKAYSMVTGQHPLYTYQSLEVLMNGNRMISHEKARKELGYAPRPLQDTLRDAISWYKEHGNIK